MAIVAHLETESGFARRSAARAPVHLESAMRKRGTHRGRVEIIDLSPDGFKAETAMILTEGVEVWLSIPGIESKSARVVWVDGSIVGCAFETPFHESVFARLVEMNAK